MIRLANEKDLDAVEQIYLDIHKVESEGKAFIGWLPGVYPVRATAEAALSRGDLYVYEDGGEVLASAIINRTQMDVYEGVAWLYPVQSDGAAVLHTLTVKPSAGGRGVGKAFVAFYEELAKQWGLCVLRMDTNAKNLRARAMYAALGYREAGIVPCVFNGIPDVMLVLLEKKL